MVRPVEVNLKNPGFAALLNVITVSHSASSESEVLIVFYCVFRKGHLISTLHGGSKGMTI